MVLEAGSFNIGYLDPLGKLRHPIVFASKPLSRRGCGAGVMGCGTSVRQEDSVLRELGRHGTSGIASPDPDYSHVIQELPWVEWARVIHELRYGWNGLQGPS